MMTKSLPSCSVLEYRFQDGICRRCVVIMVASINDMKEANDLACVRPFPSQHSDVNTLIHKDDLADTNVQPELRTEAKMKRVCARVLINVQQHLCLRSGGCKFHDRGFPPGQVHCQAKSSPGRPADGAGRVCMLLSPRRKLKMVVAFFTDIVACLIAGDCEGATSAGPWSRAAGLQSAGGMGPHVCK